MQVSARVRDRPCNDDRSSCVSTSSGGVLVRVSLACLFPITSKFYHQSYIWFIVEVEDLSMNKYSIFTQHLNKGRSVEASSSTLSLRCGMKRDDPGDTGCVKNRSVLLLLCCYTAYYKGCDIFNNKSSFDSDRSF